MALPESHIEILATGSFAPSRVVTNEDISRIVDTSDEWIVTRSGIHERRLATETENCSDMAAAAGKQAMDRAGLKPEDIDLLIIGTLTPDMMFPSTACIVQSKLGLRAIPCMDIDAACSGFIYTLEVARAMMLAGSYRHALVIGAEKLSSIINWEDRTTCVLFGDAAGAAVLGKRETEGLLSAILGADGSNSNLIHMPAGGSSLPASEKTLKERQHFLKMNGKEVFKVAVRVMENACRKILEAHGYTAADLKCVVPHQANIRIIESLSQRLEIPMDRFFINLDRYGNTSAASIPLALDEAVQAGRIQRGDLVLFVAFGAGLTFGSSLLRF
jgi:3-oxoacyl-[acyl-carrier-protein] synthase-3